MRHLPIAQPLVAASLTQLSEELHSQSSVDEEEQHEEEAQVAHLREEVDWAGGWRPGVCKRRRGRPGENQEEDFQN